MKRSNMSEDKFSELLEEARKEKIRKFLKPIESDILDEEENILYIIELTNEMFIYLAEGRFFVLKFNLKNKEFERIEAVWNYNFVNYLKLENKRIFFIFKKYFLTINNLEYKVDRKNIPKVRRLFKIIEQLKSKT